MTNQLTRRAMMQGLAGAGIAAGTANLLSLPGLAQTPVAVDLVDEIVIDLSGTPESIDPALAYSARDWSIVHSIYDAPVGFAPDGTIQPLAAESFTAIDDHDFEMVLREGLTFHDGSPVTAAAISRSLQHIRDSGSSVADLFAGITAIEEGDDGLTARITCAEPSPWLPAQVAVWMLLLPEGYTADVASSAPVGSGPYRFESQEPGTSLTLVRNPDYTWGSLKGTPMAERVTYRYVPEVATRIADLSTDAADIIVEVPVDQQGAVEDGGATPVEVSIVGSAWIRIATDTPPFDKPEVRQAINYAIDVQAIGEALVSPEARRLATLYPDERALGFDPTLDPYVYDPDKARQLLADAGVGDGIDVDLEITSAARVDVAEAIAAQLGEVGIAVTVKVSEYTDFNATWKDTSAPVLRMATWAPLFDPHTLLGLVFASEGFLSRYANPDADALIAAAAAEVDQDARQARYQELGALMHDDAAAVYLWNLSSGYGVSETAAGWAPRGDDYVIPTIVSAE